MRLKLHTRALRVEFQVGHFRHPLNKRQRLGDEDVAGEVCQVSGTTHQQGHAEGLLSPIWSIRD